jgi:hypothetical protein
VDGDDAPGSVELLADRVAYRDVVLHLPWNGGRAEAGHVRDYTYCEVVSKGPRLFDRRHLTYPLYHSLHEESWSNDTLASDESIRVDQCAANDAGENNAEATTEHLRQISDDSATSHRTQVGNNLRDRDGVR